MRYLFAGFLAAALIVGCKSDDKKGSETKGPITDSTQFTTIQWLDSTSKDFGKIQEGQVLQVAFRFKNTGAKPLVIEKVQPSCGCTVAQQSNEPVQPGAEGQIKASFNSQGRSGINHKSLFVMANLKGSQAQTLQFVVQVDKGPEGEKKP